MSDSTEESTPAPRAKRPGEKQSIVARTGLFVRQAVAELRKVIWPTRRELITYTTVVIIFVGIMAAIVAVLDYAFTQGVLAIFG